MTKSEHEARMPKLAEGSRWSTDCSEPCVTDDDGSIVVVSRIDARGGKCIAIRSGYGSSVAYVTDLLAVIRCAGLDTEHDALRLAAKKLMLAFDEFTRETHDCSECEEADFVGEHIRIDDVIEYVRKLEALL